MDIELMQLNEINQQRKFVQGCVLIIFGATGDLTSRKLVPALYNLARERRLPEKFACVAFARREKTDEQFREEMLDAVNQFSRHLPVDSELWENFSAKFSYHRSDFHEDEGYESLRLKLDEIDASMGTLGNRVFYLSTQPSFFPLATEKLKEHALIYDHHHVQDKWSRVIIEKPFGHDLNSALELQRHMVKFLDENQIYRIDHYLGKETVQNLLALRFSNPIFESIWNNRHVDHVQITVSEEMGIGTRGKFWEEAGMLRDIVQNHMMQLLSLVAMEPPTHLKPNAIRDEKVKVLDSIRPLANAEIDRYAVRGQYAMGSINGKEVKGYRQENAVAPRSNVETYVAMELFIDNWRWSGVPFYLRAGKRLPKRTTEISIILKDAPGFLFQSDGKKMEPNILVIRIQPDEGISLKMNCKTPGITAPLQPVTMDFRYGSFFGATPPEAYERLICDCMAGDSTLFTREDEVMASWRLLTPVLDHWQEEDPWQFPNYIPGSWGPEAANHLLQRAGRQWRNV